MKAGEIVVNRELQPGYHMIGFHAPEICRSARAGQFVHVRIEEGTQQILRRPFSIHEAGEDGILQVVYKVVGAGTARLAGLKPGAVCDLLGPLGTPFTPPEPEVVPILMVGGYGAAATFMLAQQAQSPGYVLLGARSVADVLLTDRYREVGFEVRVSTNDGSVGHRGLVTELLGPLLEELQGRRVKIYGCGPHPMLMALAKILQRDGIPGELSLDHLMCCGVGACFACVVKVKADTPEGWMYARTCSDGPVFPADRVYVE